MTQENLKKPIPEHPFGLEFRRQRATLFCGCDDCTESENPRSSLARFKQIEYLIRLVFHDSSVLLITEYLREILEFIGPAAHRILLEEIVAWRSERKSHPVFKDKNCLSLRDLRRLLRNDKPLVDALENQLDLSTIVFNAQKGPLTKMIRNSWRRFVKRIPAKDDSLAKRTAQIRVTVGLSEIETEILLYAFLRKTDRKVHALHEHFETNHGVGDSKKVAFTPIEAMSVLLGFSRTQLETALSPDAPILVMDLLDRELRMPDEISDYLERGGADSFTEKFFRVYRGKSLPMGAHTLRPEESGLLADMLRSHVGDRPLHILLFGVEGAGKTEFARSLGSATQRAVFEVGSNLKESLDHGEYGTSDSVVRYVLRSIQLAAYQKDACKCLLLVDEADVVLNQGEKGKINQLMERIHVPVIWIANEIGKVERSTLRRFDYSIRFRMLGQSQRQSIWTSILEKHNSTHLLPAAEVDAITDRYPVSAGGIELAVRNASALAAFGSPLPPVRVMEQVLRSHGKLLNLERPPQETIRNSPAYTLKGLNIRGNAEEILAAARSFEGRFRNHDRYLEACNLCMLFYGPPGTGKTEFARFLARELGRPLLLKRASDLLSKWVGGSEALIRNAFAEAEDAGAILFLDEADSFLQNREGATRSWEVTQVNELLTNMEAFAGLLLCATNFESALDPASRRRFHMKLEFGFLEGDGARHFWDVFFAARIANAPGDGFFRELETLPLLAPGDFKAVYERLRYGAPESLTAGRVMIELKREIGFKDSRGGRRIGFS